MYLFVTSIQLFHLYDNLNRLRFQLLAALPSFPPPARRKTLLIAGAGTFAQVRTAEAMQQNQ